VGRRIRLLERGPALRVYARCTKSALSDAHDPAVLRELNGLERGAVEPLMQLAFYE
jgi:hypothetical protein